jgi:hypothetical protein
LPLVRAHPNIEDDWIAYSEDKRTSGGWYVTESCEVGRVTDPASISRFASFPEVVAEFVIRELDYWSGLVAAS